MYKYLSVIIISLLTYINAFGASVADYPVKVEPVVGDKLVTVDSVGADAGKLKLISINSLPIFSTLVTALEGKLSTTSIVQTLRSSDDGGLTTSVPSEAAVANEMLTKLATSAFQGLLNSSDYAPTGNVDMTGASSVDVGQIRFKGDNETYYTYLNVPTLTGNHSIAAGNYDGRIPASSSVNSDGSLIVPSSGGSGITVSTGVPTASGQAYINPTTGVLSVGVSGEYYRFIPTDSVAYTGTTYTLSLTTSGFTGLDKVTINSVDYNVSSTITGLSSASTSMVAHPDTGRSITCTGAFVTGTIPNFIVDMSTANQSATCTSTATSIGDCSAYGLICENIPTTFSFSGWANVVGATSVSTPVLRTGFNAIEFDLSGEPEEASKYFTAPATGTTVYGHFLYRTSEAYSSYGILLELQSPDGQETMFQLQLTDSNVRLKHGAEYGDVAPYSFALNTNYHFWYSANASTGVMNLYVGTGLTRPTLLATVDTGTTTATQLGAIKFSGMAYQANNLWISQVYLSTTEFTTVAQ